VSACQLLLETTMHVDAHRGTYPPPPSLLIAYDGSEDAKHAISVAGQLLEHGRATLLTVWEPLMLQVNAYIPPAMPPVDADDKAEELAERVAREGAELARQSGMKADARWESDTTTVWEKIVNVADEIDASLIVTGSRGLSGLRSLIAGSVSGAVLHHTTRPVLVVPSDDA
jgi:nucleotide-binding universal stress UspA family protein